MKSHPLLAIAVLAALTAGAPAASAAEPIRVYAAGSLVAPLDQAIAASGVAIDPATGPVYSPAGLLRQRIQNGEQADLYLSADVRGPRTLAAANPGAMVVPFARNRLCLYSKAPLGVSDDGLLGRLIDPAFRLATSTPGADPGGDYSIAIFSKADRLQAGSGKLLTDKALRLLGSPNAMVPVAGKSPAASIFVADRADALLYYCSSYAEIAREVPGLAVRNLPPALDVTAVYALAVLTDHAEARRLALFLVSDRGQYILTASGLLPIDGSAVP